MKSEQESPEYKELKEKIMGLFERLDTRYGLNVSQVAYKTGLSLDSLFKYAKGGLPKKKLDKIRHIISELEKLEDSRKLEKSESIILKPHSLPKKLSYLDDLEDFYEIDSWLEDAEFETVVFDPCAEPEIRVGSKIAIKRIDIKDCEWGKYHYIIDTLKQSYLRRLYSNSDGTYKLVAETDKYPDLHFEKSKIEVVYRVVFASFKPK